MMGGKSEATGMEDPDTGYSHTYHVALRPAADCPPLDAPSVTDRVRDAVTAAADEKGLEVDTTEISPGGVHIVVSSPARFSPAELGRWFKDITEQHLTAAGIEWSDEHYTATPQDDVTDAVQAFFDAE